MAKIAEGVALQMAKLKLEVQSLQAQLQMRPSVTKDITGVASTKMDRKQGGSLTPLL
jgi:hypothetical protein